MKKLGLLLPLLGMATTLFANAGIFDGIGGNLTLTQNAGIRMVSEKVVMTPMRAPFPVDGGDHWIDFMRYHCTFKLKNLTDKEISVQVGFPLQSKTASLAEGRTSYHQADTVSRFNFVAGTANEVYAVRFEAADKEKKFQKIFLWTMKFAPEEEIDLTVTYTVNCYFGLGTLIRGQWLGGKKYRCPYLKSLSLALFQMFGYVTETGNCWAGEIEKAEFELHSAEFEAYLTRRGALENVEETKAAALEQEKRRIRDRMEKFGTGKDDPDYEKKMLEEWREKRRKNPENLLSSHFLRILTPETGWTAVEEERRGKFLKLEYAPFQPGPEITVKYIFTLFPDTPEKFDLLLEQVLKNLEREKKRKPDAEQHDRDRVRKNLADAVLEYYGIATGNEEIRDFLDNQLWYPVQTPPPLSPMLKIHLSEKERSEVIPVQKR